MSSFRIAQRYAKALLDLAEERGRIEEITSDMRMLQEIIKESRDLRVLLHSPIVKMDSKRKVLDMIFEGRVQEESLAFLRLLTDKRREFFLEGITKAFIDQYNDKMGITPAILTTAAPAKADFKTEIIGLLKQKFGKGKVELETATNEALIGGFVLRFDDKLYDSSVSSQLNSIRKELHSSTYSKN